MILFAFDLENTLIFTDKINSLSYRKALEHFDIPILNSLKKIKRITLNEIRKLYSFGENDLLKIQKLKDYFFKKNINKLKVNKKLCKFIEKNTNKHGSRIVIFTNSREQKCKILLNYLKITKFVDKIISKKSSTSLNLYARHFKIKRVILIDDEYKF